MSLASSKNMIEYYVLDVEPLGPVRGKNVLADVHVARMSDFGRNDTAFIARSHLGSLLNPGDTVMGYDLSRSNFNDDNFNALNQNALADVVLIRKSYPNRRKKTKQRNWKLQQLGKEEEEMLPRKQDQARIENDLEMFMRDLEEDPEMRSTINIFKNQVVQENKDINMDDESEFEEEDFPEVSLEEMLDEMNIQDGEPDEEFVDDDIMM
jgi:nonsense-mediated mRNA decay protein 3